MQVDVSSRFQRSFLKLHPVIQEKATLRMKIFKESGGRDPRLDVHKLHGKKKEEWAYSVDRSYRIAFVFLEGNRVLYTNIGLMTSCIRTHDVSR